MLSIHLRLGLPSGFFPSGSPTNNLNVRPNRRLNIVGEQGPSRKYELVYMTMLHFMDSVQLPYIYL
jgi:hypothetical protein